MSRLHFRIEEAERRIRELWDAYLMVGPQMDMMDRQALRSMRETLEMIEAAWEQKKAG